MVSLEAQLETARADVASLESFTGNLERNVSEQSAELERLRREARAGRAKFDEVVKQQTRHEAAQGMLRQHLDDLARAVALVGELESAAGEQLALVGIRQAWGTVESSAAQYAAQAAKLEQQLQEGLSKLRTIQQEHRAAKGEVSRLVREAAVRETGQTLNTVSTFVRSGSSPIKGDVTGEISEAMRRFVEVASPENGLEMLSLAQAVVRIGVESAQAERLSLSQWPLLSEAQRVYRGEP